MPGDSIVDRRLTKKDTLIQYLNSGTLNPDMEEMWKRYEFIEDKCRSMNRKNVMLVIRKKYELSRAQAYKLIKEVEEFSGMAHAPNKEYLRWVHLDKIQAARDMALAKGDLNAFARISDQLHKWLHEDGQIDIEILEKLKPRQFNMQVNVQGETINLDLEKFYKLQSTQMAELNKSSSEEIASWDEVEQMLDAKD